MKKSQIAIILSEVESIKQIDKFYYYQLHFKGYFLGRYVSRIVLKSKLNHSQLLKKEIACLIKYVGNDQSILKGNLLKLSLL